ncbi:uncharacterized protein LOC124912937 [Impatiens glandulifera]|uniref:uncharacterized protein LOC124912937 n=1 Tax=Impatiens glandulifera TaxID=253017 RepID=UPI001FB08660|nr:uncharacterized protein LOC124912937 [Impatiens glandulifera]
MDCNKDEAHRAKEIAERMFSESDLTGARRFAKKANSLFPDLDGVQSLISILDVYLCAERKVNGETDWYGILGVDPRADHDTIKKKYKNMVLILHPDKNKRVEANHAFGYIRESWKILSDEKSRESYDRKRRGTNQQQEVLVPSNGPDNGFSDVKVTIANQRRAGGSDFTPTFWTVCDHCKKKIEYFRIYVNRNIRCSNCRQLFLAIETAEPLDPSEAVDIKNQHSGHQYQEFTPIVVQGDSKFQWNPPSSSEPAAADIVATSDEAAAAAVIIHKDDEHEVNEEDSILPNPKRRKGEEEAE